MKSFNSIPFLSFFMVFNCNSNGLQSFKEIDDMINKSVEEDHPGTGITGL